MTRWSFVGFAVFSFFPKIHIQPPSQKEFKILTPSLVCSKWVKIFQKWLVLTWSCRRCPLFRWDGRDLVSRMGLELMPLKGEKLSRCQSIRVRCRYCHGMWDPSSLWTFLETASLWSAPSPAFSPVRFSPLPVRTVVLLALLGLHGLSPCRPRAPVTVHCGVLGALLMGQPWEGEPRACVQHSRARSWGISQRPFLWLFSTMPALARNFVDS